MSAMDIVVLGGGGPIGRAIERIGAPLSVVLASRSGPRPLNIDDEDALDELVATSRPRAIAYLVNDRTSQVEGEITRLRSALAAARRHRVERFLFASSAAVYGDAHRFRIAERDSLMGTSDYAAAKIRSEEELAAFRHDEGLSSVALRIFNVFGPGCDASLVNRLAFGPAPTLRLSNRFVRDYVHVDEVARAFIIAAERRDVTGAVNIARGIPVDNLTLASSVPIDRYQAVEGGPDSYSVADVTKARTRLGWSPSIDPVDLLRHGIPSTSC